MNQQETVTANGKTWEGPLESLTLKQWRELIKRERQPNSDPWDRIGWAIAASSKNAGGELNEEAIEDMPIPLCQAIYERVLDLSKLKTGENQAATNP